MSRDSTRTHLHLHHPHHADLLEDFTRHTLLPDEIYLAAEHQPTNPEDEEDVVPDQHAAFGIRQATTQKREAVWKDLGLEELLKGFKEGGKGVDGGSSTEGEKAGERLRRKRVAGGEGTGSVGRDLRG